MADAQTRKLARQIVDINHRLKSIETTPQLAHTSIDDHGLPVYDKEGNLVAKIGKQDDGTWGAPPLAGPTPPMPTGLQALGGPGTIHVTWTGEFSEGAACPLDFDVLEVLVNGALSGSISNRDGGSVTIAAPSGQHYVSARIRTLVPRHSSITSPFAVEVGPPADQLFIDAQEEIDGAKEEIEGAKQEIADERDAREQLAEDVQGTFTELDTRLGAFATDEALAPIRQALSDAQAAVEAAQGVAESANQAANAASQAALEAAGIAESKGRVIIQETEPTGDDRKASNIWIKPIPDDPDTEVEEKSVTYVYFESTDSWEPTTSSELAQAAQNALDAREAAQQAQQRADTAIANAAAAQSAAEAAQRTADDATLDAREAHNEAVEARERADTLWGSGDNLMAWGAPVSPLVGSATSSLSWGYVHDPGAGPDGSDSYIETTVSASQAGYTFRDQVGDTPVQKGRTYLLEWQLWTDAPTDNLAVGYFPVWRKADGTSHNTDWTSGFRPSSREIADPIGSRSGLNVDPFVSGEWRRIRELVPVPDVPESEGGPIVAWTPRLHRWNEGSTAYGGDGSAVAGERWRVADIRLRDVTDALEVEQAAQAAQSRADEAYVEAASKLDESQVQAIADEAERLAKEAAAADATAKAEQAEADAAVEAARIAQEKADAAEANAALTAQQKADAAKDAAEAWAKAEDELLEARAAADAKAKADQALADAKAALATARGEITNEIATSVNGKNSITRSTSNASGSGVVAGDAWYRVDSNGDTMAMWIWDGSKWVASKVRNEMIDTIDVNKLKVHDELEVIGDAVINKIWADGIAAKAVTASKLTVAPGNVYRDPMLTDPASWNSSYFQASGGYGGGGSILLPASASQTGSYDTLGASVAATRTRVEPGVTYRHTFWFKSSIPVEARNRVLMFRRYYALDGTQVGGTVARAQADPAPADVWTQASGEETVPEGGVTMVVGFYAQAAHNGEVRFSDPAIIPKVGAVLIEDGAIGADKIIADEVAAEVSHLIKARVENLTVTDGATIDEAVILKIASEMITAGVLRTAESGQRVVIDESGIVMYGLDPDGVEFELVRIGPDGDNLITAGDTSISPDGVQAPSGDFEEITVGGEDLSEILRPLPRGMRAWGTLEANSKFDGDTTKFARRAELQTTLLPDRLYRIQLSSHFLDVDSSSNATVREELRYSLDQTNITTGISPESSRSEWTGTWLRQHVQTGNTRSVPGMDFYLDTGGWTGERHFWVMFMILPEQADRPVRVVARWDYPVILSVEDMGPSQPGLLKRWNDGSGAGTQDPEPTKRRYTKTYTSTSFHTYDNNGNATSDADVVQGLYAGGPTRRRRRGGWKFPSFTSDLSGATVEKVEAYVYMNHSYYTAGADVNIATHNGTVSNLTSRVTVRGWKRNTGKWITIPKSLYNGFKNGTYQGVGVISTNSTAQQYARFNGSGARVRITYVK